MSGLVERMLKFVAGHAGLFRTVFPVWALACLIMVLAIGAEVGIRYKDSDDAMRLAEVRDLVAGQSWFDTTQYRVGPPTGLSMHWSRLVDLGIVGLEAVLKPFVGQGSAEPAAMMVWPLLLLLPAMWAAAAMARHLAGNAAILPAAVLFFTGGAATNQFYPGRIHHHNIQLLATLLLVLGAMRLAEGVRAGVVAGIAAAFMLAIGIETILYLPMVSAFIAWQLAREGRSVTTGVRSFGLSLAIATPGLAFLTLPPSRVLATACDMVSLPLVVSAVLAGLGFAVLPSPLARLKKVEHRLLALAGFGVAVAAIAFGLAPQCLQGPYAGLDPRLVHLYLDQITELRSLFDFLREDPWRTLSIYHIVLFAVPAAFIALQGLPARRAETGLIALLFAVSLGLGCVHIRYYTFFMAFPVPLVAGALVVLARKLVAWGLSFGAGLVAGLMALFLAPMALAAPSPGAVPATPGAPHGDCAEPASYAPLARLPVGLVLAPIDEAPFILIASRQSVFASAYHRGGAGMLATYAMMTAAVPQARPLLRQSGIAYVALCRGEKSGAFLAASAPQGLAHALLAGEVPDWLEPLALGNTPLLVYRLR